MAIAETWLAALGVATLTPLLADIADRSFARLELSGRAPHGFSKLLDGGPKVDPWARQILPTITLPKGGIKYSGHASSR